MISFQLASKLLKEQDFTDEQVAVVGKVIAPRVSLKSLRSQNWSDIELERIVEKAKHILKVGRA